MRLSIRASALFSVRLALVAAVWGLVAAAPARAQITFGSPDDPARVAFGAGAFDITPSDGIKRGGSTGEMRGEYRFGDLAWIIAPFVGASGTTQGAVYGFFGFGFDVNFTPNIVLTPNAAAGYFTSGQGTRLGSRVEFRTGAELAWRFDDKSRIGLEVTHTSNAGITKRNPGEQSVLVMYSLPMHWGP